MSRKASSLKLGGRHPSVAASSSSNLSVMAPVTLTSIPCSTGPLCQHIKMWTGCRMPFISILERLMWVDLCEFEVSLIYWSI